MKQPKKTYLLPKFIIWRYKDADFQKACTLMNETEWDSLLPADPDIAADKWHEKYPYNSSLPMVDVQPTEVMVSFDIKSLFTNVPI